MSSTKADETPAGAVTESCDQCGAPAEHEQRYCLNCGAHRRQAPDPVARYFGEASAARARVAAARAAAAGRRRTPRLGIRLVVALVALALLVGVLIGNATAGNAPSHGAAAKHPAAQRQKTSTVKNVTGSSYLQQEEDLPSSVTP